jgi:acetyl-CoA acetyltransferase
MSTSVRGGRTSEASEAFRPGSGPHWEHPQYGWSHQGGLAALSFRRYLHLYGGQAEQLGQVAVAQRQFAQLNPWAVYQKPLTIDDYRDSRVVMDPLRLFDFAVINDGGVCLIITTAERARDLKKPPAYISGMQGMRAGRQQVIFAMPGLGVGAQDVFRYQAPKTQKVYEMAGLTRDEVDVLQIYDSFSPEVIYGLEQFGFCPSGEALSWIQNGRTAPGGQLPVNTHGGHLSAGMVGGWAHLVEAVRQVRGECGERQVNDVRVAQYVAGPFASVIFSRQ